MILGLSGFFSVLISIIVFILVIGTIILIHEFGHFIFAKKAGILCHEFSIGMGPVIFQKKKNETTFSIRAIPIGGYVAMAGEQNSNDILKKGQTIGLVLDEFEKVTHLVLHSDAEPTIKGDIVSYNLYGEHGEELSITLSIDGEEKSYFVHENAMYVFSKKQQMQITPYNRSFESKSLGQRFMTLFAGPAMNFVLAIFIYFIYWCAVGVPNTGSSQIGEVTANYYGQLYLEESDVITKVNNVSVDSWDSFSLEMDKLKQTGETSVEIGVNRDGKDLDFDIPLIVIINSCGLNNIGLTNNESAVDSVMMGDTSAFNYVSDTKDGEVLLKTGDIIQEIRIDAITVTKENGFLFFKKKKETITEGEFVKVESWTDVINIMNDVDVANVYFKFYSQDNKQIYETQTAIRTYGNELLENQRIEKVQLLLGVSPETHFNFGGAFKNTFTSFWSDFTLIFKTLQILIAPSGVRQVGVNNLSGVVGIFSMVESYLKFGLLPLLALIAMLSINIGVMNLLPIPALDGGRIVFLAYEGITRRKPNKKVENTLNNIVFILLMVLFVYITFHDILRLFG